MNQSIWVPLRLLGYTSGGPGLLESLYEKALYQELRLQDISVEAQVQIPVIYIGNTLRNSMRLDLLVDSKVIIEVKATEQEQAVHKAQVLTYLRLTGLKLELLLNFGKGLLTIYKIFGPCSLIARN